jgi:hypothetical protein
MKREELRQALRKRCARNRRQHATEYMQPRTCNRSIQQTEKKCNRCECRARGVSSAVRCDACNVCTVSSPGCHPSYVATSRCCTLHVARCMLHAACCPILHVIHCMLSAVACCKYLWRRDANAILRAVVDELDKPNTTPQERRMQCTTVTRHSTHAVTD